MMKRLIAALLVCSATPAAAQELCGPATEVFEQFAEQYGERISAIGDHPGGFQVVILTNPTTGTFSVMHSDGQTACMVSLGANFAMKFGTAL
jgi:hypothetical protein